MSRLAGDFQLHATALLASADPHKGQEDGSELISDGLALSAHAHEPFPFFFDCGETAYSSTYFR